MSMIYPTSCNFNILDITNSENMNENVLLREILYGRQPVPLLRFRIVVHLTNSLPGCGVLPREGTAREA